MEKPEVYEYEVCRVCGSKEKFIASLAAQEIDKGINPAAVSNYLQVWPFVLRKPNYPVIIGSRTPAGNVFLDICKGCGIVRAIRVEVGEAIALDKPLQGG